MQHISSLDTEFEQSIENMNICYKLAQEIVVLVISKTNGRSKNQFTNYI